jgi:hypothetical protein
MRQSETTQRRSAAFIITVVVFSGVLAAFVAGPGVQGQVYTTRFSSVQQTSDGGYIILGDKNEFEVGFFDGNTERAESLILLIKTDPYGNIRWSKTYSGGSDFGTAEQVKETADNGYAILAQMGDLKFIRTDQMGNVKWTKTYSGSNPTSPAKFLKAGDGGYIIVTTKDSSVLQRDVWLFKTDANGNIEWERTHGVYGVWSCTSFQMVKDGGYLIGGSIELPGEVTKDYLLLETDQTGTPKWDTTFEGSGYNYVLFAEQTLDGGYVYGGQIDTGPALNIDFWLLRLDQDRNILWNRTYGGAEGEDLSCIYQATDGGYLLLGETYPYFPTQRDVWLVKTDPQGHMNWNKTFGVGEEDDYFVSIGQTSDGGYVTASQRFSTPMLMLIIMDAYGSVKWTRSLSFYY